MKKEYRIKKSNEIETIIKKKQSAGNKYYVIYAVKNSETNHFRLALSVSKKLGNAVLRNRLKRQIRSNIQSISQQIKNYDIFIVLRKEAINLSVEEREVYLVNLLKRLNVC